MNNLWYIHTISMLQHAEVAWFIPSLIQLDNAKQQHYYFYIPNVIDFKRATMLQTVHKTGNNNLFISF